MKYWRSSIPGTPVDGYFPMMDFPGPAAFFRGMEMKPEMRMDVSEDSKAYYGRVGRSFTLDKGADERGRPAFTPEPVEAIFRGIRRRHGYLEPDGRCRPFRPEKRP